MIVTPQHYNDLFLRYPTAAVADIKPHTNLTEETDISLLSILCTWIKRKHLVIR